MGGKVLTEIEIDPESERVIKWRTEWLRDAGFSKRNADLLASATNVNLWFACDAIRAAKNKGYDEDFIMGLLL